jgi:predicted HicB family RNase H-like nuclease
MSANMMHYKGYPARVEYSAEDGCLVGRVLGIRDVIGFHGDSVAEAENDFREAVDFYLESCERRGKTPNLPENGDIPFSIPAGIYSRISLAAEVSGQTIDDMVIDALQTAYPAGRVKKARAKTHTVRKGRRRELVGRQ